MALAVSGGLVAERLSLGGTNAAIVANLAASVAAVVMFSFARGAPPVESDWLAVLPQIAGVLAGTLAVHAWLIVGPYRTHAWLAEGPRQLVNDFVASFSILLAAWACARRRTIAGIGAIGCALAAYRLTTPLWHLDSALFRTITVQQLVLAESLAAFVAIVIFRAVASVDLE